jgi:hypothetical protein
LAVEAFISPLFYIFYCGGVGYGWRGRGGCHRGLPGLRTGLRTRCWAGPRSQVQAQQGTLHDRKPSSAANSKAGSQHRPRPPSPRLPGKPGEGTPSNPTPPRTGYVRGGTAVPRSSPLDNPAPRSRLAGHPDPRFSRDPRFSSGGVLGHSCAPARLEPRVPAGP